MVGCDEDAIREGLDEMIAAGRGRDAFFTRVVLPGVTPRPIGRDENILRRVRVGIEPRPLSRQTNDQTICTQNTEIPGPRGLVIAIRVTPISGALHYPSLQSAMSSLRLRPAGDCDWLGLWPPSHGLGPSGPPIVSSALRPPVSQISTRDPHSQPKPCVTPRPIGRDENILRRVRVGIEPRPLSRQTNDQTICTQNTEIPGPRGLVIAIRVTPISGALHPA